MSVITEGKTKIVRNGSTQDTVLIETKDVLTGGDAAIRKSISEIGIEKTTQAANVFSLLGRHGMPISFIERVSPRELLCYRCEMLPMELVVRRYAWGTYLLRHPEFCSADDSPVRFNEPVCEFFHKWSVVAPPIAQSPYQMDEESARQQFLRDGVWAKGVFTDPYIQLDDQAWTLYPAKKSLSEAEPLMQAPPMCTSEECSEIIDSIMVPAFLILENAWRNIATIHGPVIMVDLKLEVGRRVSDGKLVVGDVIDNDSWRIWPGGDRSKQLDKQCFRDGDPVASIAENYRVVTALTGQFT